MKCIQDTQIFIGFDPRESEAFNVCASSVRKFGYRSNTLYSRAIPRYERDFGEPQSTDFTFTRFWVPYLSNYQGFSIFCDCDFLWLKSPAELLKEIDNTKAVSVVKHPRYIPNSVKKMDNINQNSYFRKNWSSLMVFNNEHPDTRNLTLETVNNASPKYLHRMEWAHDKHIGELPLEYNWLEGEYSSDITPKAIHFTNGGPWHNTWDGDYKEFWNIIYKKL